MKQYRPRFIKLIRFVFHVMCDHIPFVNLYSYIHTSPLRCKKHNPESFATQHVQMMCSWFTIPSLLIGYHPKAPSHPVPFIHTQRLVPFRYRYVHISGSVPYRHYVILYSISPKIKSSSHIFLIRTFAAAMVGLPQVGSSPCSAFAVSRQNAGAMKSKEVEVGVKRLRMA